MNATHTPTPKAYRVMVNGLRAGAVVYQNDWQHPGWKFIPAFQANASRKLWPTPEAAIKGRVSASAVLEACS